MNDPTALRDAVHDRTRRHRPAETSRAGGTSCWRLGESGTKSSRASSETLCVAKISCEMSQGRSGPEGSQPWATSSSLHAERT